MTTTSDNRIDLDDIDSVREPESPALAADIDIADAVLDALEVRPGERALDLYCGAGLFAGVLDRAAVLAAQRRLRHAAGNFYVNDKPTGSIVARQPFGGSRASGTNDKAGSKANLMRWTSTRTIKETFVPPADHRYPHMGQQA